MRPILKRFPSLTNCPLNRVHRLSHPVKIFLRDKDCIRIWQLTELLPRVQVFHIHHAGMIPGPLGLRTPILPLNLNIILFPAGILTIRIQTNRTRPSQTLHILLRLAVNDNQVRLARENAQYQFHQRNIVLEHTAHKIIVNRPETAQPFQVLQTLFRRRIQNASPALFSPQTE